MAFPFLPTPVTGTLAPLSDGATPPVAAVSVSTRFCPRDDYPSDIIIYSSDGVEFYVHRSVLALSTNGFAGVLDSQSPFLYVTDNSNLMNLILHAFYDYDPSPYKPSISEIDEVSRALPRYGLSIFQTTKEEGSAFHKFIISLARTSPLATYALVCHHNLEHLAIPVSGYLTAIPLYNLTDEHCATMGPIYLRRLVFLHLGRTERLRSLLHEALAGHEITLICDSVDQQRHLFVAWDQACHELCAKINASTSVSLLKTHLSPVVEKMSCPDCKTCAREGIRKVILEWTMIKSTI